MPNYLENGKILIFMNNEEDDTVITKEGDVAAIFFKVSSENENGTEINIDFDENNTQISNNIMEKINHLVNYQNLTLKVADDDLNTIESDVYVINREKKYIYATSANTTIQEYLSNFKNNYLNLNIIDKDEKEITDYSKFITINMKIRLIKKQELKDELTIIIKGDINGDGDTTIADKVKLKKYLLAKVDLNSTEKIAVDLNNDGLIDITDHIIYQTFLNMKLNNLNN